jgi:hypothetical protein
MVQLSTDKARPACVKTRTRAAQAERDSDQEWHPVRRGQTSWPLAISLAFISANAPFSTEQVGWFGSKRHEAIDAKYPGNAVLTPDQFTLSQDRAPDRMQTGCPPPLARRHPNFGSWGMDIILPRARHAPASISTQRRHSRALGQEASRIARISLGTEVPALSIILCDHICCQEISPPPPDHLRDTRPHSSSQRAHTSVVGRRVGQLYAVGTPVLFALA